MKKVIFNFLLILSSLGFGCGDDNDPKPNPNTNPLIGDWLNERKDTITFEDWSTGEMLIYKNYNPVYHKIYSYSIKGDTICLEDIFSSTFPIPLYYHYFKHSGDSIEIHEFNGIELTIYKKIMKK